jgi:hypothetical protein
MALLMHESSTCHRFPANGSQQVLEVAGHTGGKLGSALQPLRLHTHRILLLALGDLHSQFPDTFSNTRSRISAARSLLRRLDFHPFSRVDNDADVAGDVAIRITDRRVPQRNPLNGAVAGAPDPALELLSEEVFSVSRQNCSSRSRSFDSTWLRNKALLHAPLGGRRRRRRRCAASAILSR